jgi:hypothetical protein
MKKLAVALVVALAAPGVARAAGPQLTVSLDRHSFSLGDPFHYTVEARIPATTTVQVTADLGPFTAVAAPSTTRTREHGAAVVRIEQLAVCLDRGCAPGAKAREVKLPRPTARWDGGSLTAPRPQVTLVPRVSASAVSAARARYLADTSVPARPGLGLAAALLGAGALVALAFAVALLALAVRREPRRSSGAARTLSFDEAVRLLRESRGRPAPDRRRAADFAGRASARWGDGATAADAARIAWSPPDPDASEVGVLADRLERRDGE